MADSRDIAFLMGPPCISGGMYVIFQHALHAKALGHRITMITLDTIEEGSLDWHPEAKTLNWITFDEAASINFNYCFATWWKTSLDIHKIQADSYGYFVQSIESKFYPDSDVNLQSFVESTYFLPVNYITEATWIKDYLEDKYGHQVSLAKNGIRKDIYKESLSLRSDNKLRVLIEGPLHVPFKNVEKTIKLAIDSNADEIWLLTSTEVKSLPGVDRVFSQVPITKTPEIYGACDVLVKLSYVEGMFGPPLEMFHCGGTSIVYDVSGHDEYIEDGINGIVIKTNDERGVISAINGLKDNKDKLLDLKKGAIATAQAWPNWKESSQEFWDQVFQNFIVNKEKQKTIGQMNQIHLAWYSSNSPRESLMRKYFKVFKGKVARFLKRHNIKAYLYLKRLLG